MIMMATVTVIIDGDSGGCHDGGTGNDYNGHNGDTDGDGHDGDRVTVIIDGDSGGCHDGGTGNDCNGHDGNTDCDGHGDSDGWS